MMYPTVLEETNTIHRTVNARMAYIDARERDRVAAAKHKVFDTEKHVDRLTEVCDKLRSFFGCHPSYITRRGLGSRKPFEAVKMADVGRYLNRLPRNVKDEFYKELFDMGGIEMSGKNGHFIVRIYA